jgi:hypothetical protein
MTFVTGPWGRPDGPDVPERRDHRVSTPTASGSYALTVQITGTSGQNAMKTVTLTIAAAAAVRPGRRGCSDPLTRHAVPQSGRHGPLVISGSADTCAAAQYERIHQADARRRRARRRRMRARARARTRATAMPAQAMTLKPVRDAASGPN